MSYFVCILHLFLEYFFIPQPFLYDTITGVVEPNVSEVYASHSPPILNKKKFNFGSTMPHR